VLGTPIPSIIATEDRDVFAQKLNEIGEKMALSYCATTLDEGLAAARRIGFPVLIRAAFALGGLGSGFAENEEDFLATARKAFSSSDQVRVTLAAAAATGSLTASLLLLVCHVTYSISCILL
jgi:carbamoylphosphate synthase large subunit